MILTSNQIQEILPHRYPFLMLDRVVELEPGVGAVAEKCVTVNEAYFLGHFPQEHVMPGVLIIEAIAQLGAITVLSMEENKGKTAYFAGIKSAKFRGKVIPGDKIRIDVKITRLKSNIGIGEGKAFVDDKLVCQSEMTVAIGE